MHIATKAKQLLLQIVNIMRNELERKNYSSFQVFATATLFSYVSWRNTVLRTSDGILKAVCTQRKKGNSPP